MKLLLALLILFCGLPSGSLRAQAPAFTYQGHLTDGGASANGNYDIQFTLKNALTAGATVTGTTPLAVSPVVAVNGIFTATLNFGTAAFDGSDRWLELAVRPFGSSDPYIVLDPRQKITATPYALKAASISGSLSAANIPAGTITGPMIAAGTVIPGQMVGTTVQFAAANTSYEATSATITRFLLPATANVGDVVQVTGTGGGGWSFDPRGAQTIVAPWIPRESIRDWSAVASSADGIRLIAAVFNGQLYTSTDAGVNWTARDSDRRWRAVASSADGVKLVAVVHPGQIFTSTDSGATWTPRDSTRSWRCVASSGDGTKLVAGVFGGQIYTSVDSGVSWSPRETARFWRSVASSVTGFKLVAVAQSGRIYTSTNAGIDWTPRADPGSWSSVASSEAGVDLVAVEKGGRIHTSIDSGVTWTPREANREWESVACSADGERMVAVEYPGRIHTSTDFGLNWTVRESERFWAGVTSSITGQSLAAVESNGRIYTSHGGTVVGKQAEAATLKYMGNGEWQVINAPVSADLASRSAPQTFSGDNIFSSAGNSFTGSGAGLDSLSASNVSTGTLSDLRLSNNVALRGAANTFSGNNIFSSAGNSFTGSGAGLNSLSATNVSAGTLSDSRLSANVAMRNSANSFTGSQTFNVDPAKTLQIRYDSGVVPGINISGTDGNLGVLRLRNKLEVWASDDAARAGGLDIRNTSGAATLTMDGGTGNLTITGAATKPGGGAWSGPSDRRIKTGITPVTGALETLDRVRLVGFRYTAEYRAAHPGVEDRRYLNVVAQEFARVFPDHVQASADKLPDGSPVLHVDPWPLTIYSAAAVQELHKETKVLRAENADLRKRMERLEALLLKGGRQP